MIVSTCSPDVSTTPDSLRLTNDRADRYDMGRLIDFDAQDVTAFLAGDYDYGATRLSVYFPLDRGARANKKSILFNNMLTEARNALARRDMDRRSMAKIIDELERRLEGREVCQRRVDGLAILVDLGRCMTLKCPYRFRPHVSASDSYWILPLLPLLGKDLTEEQEASLVERVGSDGCLAGDSRNLICEAAFEGRVEILLVDAAIASTPGCEASGDLNRAVLATLRRGGTALALHPSRMPCDSGAAALLRR
jgi:hypothetical protein